MRIAWFNTVITPEIGKYIAGYDFQSPSVTKLDDLYMSGLCLDDGNRKALLISFDLLALDQWYVNRVRKECAEILGTDEAMILLTCTHNHSGPEAATPLKPNDVMLNKPYVDWLEQKILEEVRNLHEFTECEVAFYSSRCDENRNRRYVTADNCASFTPHRREVVPLALEYADKEFGELCFFKIVNGRRMPLYVVGNYAAHPLAGHSPGLGCQRLSADYPGYFRDYVTKETGVGCMFISGAAGDMIPKEDEMGSEAAKNMGIRLGMAAIGGICDSARNWNRFHIEDPVLGGSIKTFTVPIRRKYLDKVHENYKGENGVTLEIQCLSIGDICFVGVPGEVCAELGQEIKWHSPFRKAFIAYYSTADFSYIAPANFLVSGGYEGSTQQFGSMGGFELVKTAVECMFSLRESLHPLQPGEEPYPDNLDQPLVNIPKN